MTSTVSPVGSDPSRHDSVSDIESDPLTVRKGRLRRIAEEEYILVVLLAGFGLIFLLIFPPALVVNDSWLNLVAGREVVENGLPHSDALTVYGLGATWTDQQWLAQVFMYAVYSLGGFALLSIATCVSVVGAFSIAAARRTLAGRRRAGVLGDVPSCARRRAVGVVDPRTDARAAAVYEPPVAPRDAGAPPLAASVARVPTARRLGERPRQRRAGSAPGDAPRRLRARPQPRRDVDAEPRPRRARAPRRARDPVRAGGNRALLPPAAGRSAVRGSRDRVASGPPRPRTRCSSTCSRRSRSCSYGSGGAD